MSSTDAFELNAEAALTQRIQAAAAVLRPDRPSREPGGQAALLRELVGFVHHDLTPARIWLLYAALSTVMPSAEEVRAAIRVFELGSVDEAQKWLIDATAAAGHRCGNPGLELRILTNSVIVEVDYSARFNLHTGIQRVTRAVLPRWRREYEIVPVAWAPGGSMTRTLAADENERVMSWHGGRANEANRSNSHSDPSAWCLVLPWDCVVVLPEVPSAQVSERLAGLAELSANRVVAIGYDCIPIVSADLVPATEPNRFVRYLSIVKHMKCVAGISRSAAAEFGGFAAAVTAQGLPGPKVVECPLADDVSELTGSPTRGRSDSNEPTILCVGSLDPRKNQIAVLFAAEQLWREGLRFRLELIGGSSWGGELPALIKRLVKLGRPVEVRRAVSDADLTGAYEGARFTVFVSLHEGYGLPVVESQAFGVPVITTDYGSTAELGARGGSVLVDPRDDEQLTAAMRDLLVDDTLLERLRAELTTVSTRTWDDYARDLWALLVEPEQSAHAP